MLRRTRAGKGIEVRGVEFGRSIENSMSRLDNGPEHFLINVRRKNRAVVLSLEEYENLMKLRTVASELSEKYKELQLRVEGDKFDLDYLLPNYTWSE